MQERDDENRTTNERRRKKKHILEASHNALTPSKTSIAPHNQKPKMTKVERKAVYKDCKKTLEQSIKDLSNDDTDNSESEGTSMSVPSNFKRYTIADRKILLQQPQRTKIKEAGESYDGPEDSKKVDLPEPGEEPRPVYIAIDLT